VADRTIPQRELRNDITAILRAVEQEGATFIVTVRGKPVARLGPADEEPGPRRFVDRETLLKMYADSPVDSEAWLKEMEELDAWAEDDEDDTWPEYKELR
jgi:prevent-host-death family protein